MLNKFFANIDILQTTPYLKYFKLQIFDKLTNSDSKHYTELVPRKISQVAPY